MEQLWFSVLQASTLEPLIGFSFAEIEVRLRGGQRQLLRQKLPTGRRSPAAIGTIDSRRTGTIVFQTAADVNWKQK